MNVLLTGGTGYIGSHTALVLSEFGHQVTLFDNLSNSKKSVVARIESIIGRSCSFVEGDVCDSDLLTATLAEYSIDAVVHFAGLKAVGKSSENPIDYYFNNVQGSISLVKAMETQRIRTLVFSSSATVYGSPQQLPLNEEHPTDPANPYGRSKLHIEEMLNDLAQSNQDWRVVCLRYFNPVGAHDSGLIGEQPQGTPNNLMPLITQVAVGQRSELRVFGNDYPTPDGTGVRDYIHVMDLADGHAAALEFLKESLGVACD
jgi:UDP-glucose 4-epimerase